MIDWDRIAELQEEVGEEDFAEVLDMFFSEVEDALNGLSDASPEGWASGLHFLKGAALNIGMEALSTQCRDAEIALKTDPGAQIEATALRATLQASQDELRDLIA